MRYSNYSKQLMVRKGVVSKLNNIKREGESYSDVIERCIDTKGNTIDTHTIDTQKDRVKLSIQKAKTTNKSESIDSSTPPMKTGIDTCPKCNVPYDYAGTCPSCLGVKGRSP